MTSILAPARPVAALLLVYVNADSTAVIPCTVHAEREVYGRHDYQVSLDHAVNPDRHWVSEARIRLQEAPR